MKTRLKAKREEKNPLLSMLQGTQRVTIEISRSEVLKGLKEIFVNGKKDGLLSMVTLQPIYYHSNVLEEAR